MERAIAHKKKASVVGHLCPFVEIEGDRIRTFDAGKAWRNVRCQDCKRAECAVNMEPKIFAARDVRKADKIIDGANIDRAGGTDNQEWREPRMPISDDGTIERSQIDLLKVICGDYTKRSGTEAREIHSLGNASVGGCRRIGRNSWLPRSHTVAADSNPECGSSRNQYTKQIGH